MISVRRSRALVFAAVVASVAACGAGGPGIAGGAAGTGKDAGVSGENPVVEQMASPVFNGHWRDGKAEMNGYQITVRRYGEDRAGEGVMIFVTEPFSRSRLVKLDDPSASPNDLVDVLKLNFVMDFQTGVYDYNTMTSVFSRIGSFEPLKISFSSAEWCGHVYDEMSFRDGVVKETYKSYFDGESRSSEQTHPDGGVTEEDLYIRLRGLSGPFLNSGEKVDVPFLPSVFFRRLAHGGPAWVNARIERSSASEVIDVTAGSFATYRYDIRVEGGREGRVWIEGAYPHRIVKWHWTGRVSQSRGRVGEAAYSGELSGSTRMSYWGEKAEGDEELRALMGLGSRSGR